MGNHLTNNFFREVPSNLSRYIKRKTRRFNVIPRAEKYIDKIPQTAVRAPTYESTMKLVEKLKKGSS